jgi:hypothetical protein
VIKLTDEEVERAIALCDSIVAAAGRMEKLMAEAKKEIAVLARDLAKAMEDADATD